MNNQGDDQEFQEFLDLGFFEQDEVLDGSLSDHLIEHELVQALDGIPSEQLTKMALKHGVKVLEGLDALSAQWNRMGDGMKLKILAGFCLGALASTYKEAEKERVQPEKNQKEQDPRFWYQQPGSGMPQSDAWLEELYELEESDVRPGVRSAVDPDLPSEAGAGSEKAER